MADPVRLPHSDPERPLREVTAYLHGELSAEEKAAFEAHLPSCADCRESVQVGRLVFAKVGELFAEDRRPRRATDAMALFDEAEARVAADERKEAASRRKWPARRLWAPVFPWLAAAAGTAVAAAAAVLFLLRPPAALVPELTSLVASDTQMAMAPVPPHVPGTVEPPPAVATLPLQASVAGGQLLLRSPRRKGDRFVALDLRDAADRLWVVRHGETPDPTCAKGCGPLDLRVDIARLPAGRIRALLVVSDKPIPGNRVEEWFRMGAWQKPPWFPAAGRGMAIAEVRKDTP